MRLYLDNSALSFVGDRAQGSDVRAALNTAGHRVLASETNILELWAIDDAAKRSREVENLLTLASGLFDLPHPYRQAEEFVGELQRLRPEWTAPGSNAAQLAEERDF